jgi:hypothetical protein
MLLHHGLIIIMRRQPIVQVMGFNPSTFHLHHRIQHYKQVNTKNLRKEKKSVSYQPLGLADVTICPIVVHRWLDLSVLPVPL